MKTNKILLIGIMMVFLVTTVSAVENTNVTGDPFTVAILELLISFSALWGIIIAGAILFFFLRGGSDYVNPWGVLILGGFMIVIFIILGPELVKLIVDLIWS